MIQSIHTPERTQIIGIWNVETAEGTNTKKVGKCQEQRKNHMTVEPDNKEGCYIPEAEELWRP